ncbi:hypothetical protein [Polymorphospora lycopeni]|uniref:YCII-related domain-containing protein n=1 Tax=Polymorphospora lycopeni TaxID=3140240 RepID=A0ABV5CPL4_9ACTN
MTPAAAERRKSREKSPGMVSGPGRFVIVDVTSREEALAWAAKFAVACRCAQEVRALMPDPETDAMLRQADRRR